MTDLTPSPSSPDPVSDPTFATSVQPAPVSVPPKKRRRWGLRILVTLLAVLIVGGGLWTWIALHLSFASGEKQGYVQTLERKGVVCKTWEGELAASPLPGSTAAPEVIPFTIRDDSVATSLQRSAGRLVALQYEDHRGVPTSCFGETGRYVVGFRVVP